MVYCLCCMSFRSVYKMTHFCLQGETYKKEKQLVKDAAEFLVLHQIPSFVSIFFLLVETEIEMPNPFFTPFYGYTAVIKFILSKIYRANNNKKFTGVSQASSRIKLNYATYLYCFRFVTVLSIRHPLLMDTHLQKQCITSM